MYQHSAVFVILMFGCIVLLGEAATAMCYNYTLHLRAFNRRTKRKRRR